MFPLSRLSRRSALIGAAAAFLPASSRGSSWPDDSTINWIVPFQAGGLTDAFARPVAQRVSESIGQTIVIDNRGGAGGTIAAAQAARAAPDGYTFLVAFTGLAYAPVIYPNAGFEFGRDFEPISALARTQSSLVVNPERLDVRSVREFVEHARRAPGSIDVASIGLGTTTHLAIDMLQKRAGIELHHVPYRGGAAALRDLLAGHVAATFMSIGTLTGYVNKGDLRVLAVAGRRRERLMPEVPTMEEAGFPDFRVVNWFGVFAPRRTGSPILDRMHAAIQQALAEPAIKRLWLEQAARVEPESRADFSRFVEREIDRWSRTARAANVQME